MEKRKMRQQASDMFRESNFCFLKVGLKKGEK